MSWNSIPLPSGSKLFRVHTFNFLHLGVNFLIEIDEFGDGKFSGHAEHANDSSYVIESVSAASLEKCVETIVKKIEVRSKNES